MGGVAPAALFKQRGRRPDLGPQPPARGTCRPVPSGNRGAGRPAGHSICPWPGDPRASPSASPRRGLADRRRRRDAGGRRTTAWFRATCPRRPARAPCASASTTCAARRSSPRRLYIQFHGGVYRSDDAGETWIDIGAAGLPSDFGFPLVDRPGRPRQRLRHPARRGRRPRHAGRPRARLRDARPRGDLDARGAGLPAGDAYLTVLRQAFSDDGEPPSASTSAPRRARSSARPTAARPGTSPPSTCRPSSRCAPAGPGGRPGASLST